MLLRAARLHCHRRNILRTNPRPIIAQHVRLYNGGYAIEDPQHLQEQIDRLRYRIEILEKNQDIRFGFCETITQDHDTNLLNAPNSPSYLPEYNMHYRNPEKPEK